jgi:hypothetical protein
MTDEIGHGIDVVVAQGAGLLGRLELRGEGEDRLVPALFLHDFFEGVTLTGTGVADVDPLALEVVQALDIGVAARQHGEDLTLQREDSADVIHLAFALEWLQTFHGLVLMVRLHDAEVEFAAAQTIDVGYAAAAGGCVALEVFSVAVDEATDRLPGDIVNACLATGADGHELLLRLSHTAQPSPRQSGGKYPCQGFAFHGFTPYWLFWIVSRGLVSIGEKMGV